MPLRRLLVLMIGNFLVATSFMSVGALLTEIATSLRISIQQAGLLIAAFGISAAVCAPLLATAGSRIDRRLLLTASMAICALANLLTAFSQSFEQLLWLRVLAAVTSAVYTPQVAATLSMLVAEGERAPTLVKLMMGWTVGQVVGTPLAVLIADAYGWRAAFAGIGAASAMVAVLVWYSLPAGVRVPLLSLERWYQVFTNPALRWLTAATALTNVGSSVLFSYLAPIVKAVQGISGVALSALLLTQGVGGLVGNLISVRLVRRFGAANVAYKCNLSSAALLLLWPLAASAAALIYVAQFLWSLGGAGFPAVQQARLVAVAPSLAAATIALNSSCTYLGGSIGAAIGSLAWPLLAPRFMPWIGLIFVLAALACSVGGERAARAAPKF